MPRVQLFDGSESQYVQPVKDRIKQLRLNMLVHSFIYYELNDSLISDHEWQRRADELTRMQAQHGTKFDCYDDAFKDWDGSTGYHLPVDLWVRSKSAQLLDYRDARLRQEQEPRRRIQLQDNAPIVQRRTTRKEIL